MDIVAVVQKVVLCVHALVRIKKGIGMKENVAVVTEPRLCVIVR